jgi:hypothetical protein
MRKFFHWWLAMVVFMAFQLGIAALMIFAVTVAARQSHRWIALSVMLLVVSALSAGAMAWTSGPTPPWFRKLVTRLNE